MYMQQSDILTDYRRITRFRVKYEGASHSAGYAFLRNRHSTRFN